MGCSCSSEKPIPAFLPSQDPFPDIRARLLADAKRDYQWAYDPKGNYPKYFKKNGSLPPPDQPDPKVLAASGFDIGDKVLEIGFNTALAFAEGRMNDGNPFDDYKDMFPRNLRDPDGPPRMLPPIAAVWRSDEAFGQMRLNLLDPLTIRLFDAPLPNFPVSEADVEEVLPKGRTLAGEMASGRLYIVDLTLLAKVPKPSYTAMCAPLCLLWARDDGAVVPLAIQLMPEFSAESNPIFTPKDKAGLWLWVKICFQHANGVFHENCLHFFRSHLFPETLYVAARRTLAARHPLMQLLAPHAFMTLVINESARFTQTTADGLINRVLAGAALIDELVGEANRDFDFRTVVVPRDINEVRRVGALPGYHYRDDALALWSATEAYVAGVLGIFYTGADAAARDAAVLGDVELQAFATELLDKQPGWRNFPVNAAGQVATFADVVTLATAFIMTSAALHTALNANQFDMRGFIPNLPAILKKDRPTTKARDYTDKEMAAALPNFKESTIQIAAFHSFSLPPPAKHRLGAFSPVHFQLVPAAKPAITAYQEQLKALSARIDERNKAAKDSPYKFNFCNPNQIWTSVAT